jgi:hypothetical protein
MDPGKRMEAPGFTYNGNVQRSRPRECSASQMRCVGAFSMTRSEVTAPS